MEEVVTTVPNYTSLIVTVVLAILSSSGLFALIQFFVSRHDKKHDKTEECSKKLSAIKKQMEDSDNIIHEAIIELTNKIEQNHIIQARIRIIRANEEIRTGHHSYEYFRQLNQDITEYEQYCKSHPEFKNNEAVNSIEYINRVYQKCLDSNSFLI